MIDTFRGRYYFLSNMYLCRVEYEGLVFNSVESAFQACKTLDTTMRKTFCNMDPMEAKRLGKTIVLQDSWDTIKDGIMEELVRDKFTRNPKLKQFLIETGDQQLVEGNIWKDKYWGVYKGKGENKLGKILMKIRDEIKSGTENNI